MPCFTTFVYLSAYLGAFLSFSLLGIPPSVCVSEALADLDSSFIANAAIVTQTHTLYYVPQPTTTTAAGSVEVQETAIYEPISTLGGGSVTQYQKVDIQSLVIVHNPSPVNSLDPTVFTLVSQPVTRTSTQHTDIIFF